MWKSALVWTCTYANKPFVSFSDTLILVKFASLSPDPMTFIFPLHKRHTLLTASWCRHAVMWWGEMAFFRPLISLCKCAVHKSCLLLFATIWFMRPYSNKAEQGGLGLAMLVMSEGFKGVKGLNLVWNLRCSWICLTTSYCLEIQTMYGLYDMVQDDEPLTYF